MSNALPLYTFRSFGLECKEIPQGSFFTPHFIQSFLVFVFPARVTLTLFHSHPFLSLLEGLKGQASLPFFVVSKVNTFIIKLVSSLRTGKHLLP